MIGITASRNGTRNANLGGGPYLIARNVDSARACHTDGLYWKRPWDMTQFGAPGAAAIAASGYRYAWIWSSDHYDPTVGWGRGGGVYLGWSNDIAIIPQFGTEIFTHTFVYSAVEGSQLETPWLLWKEEDATDPWRLYLHGGWGPAGGQSTFVLKSATLSSWTIVGQSHPNDTGVFGGHSGYQCVFRAGLNDYWSFGLNGSNAGVSAVWTSTDAETFSLGSNISSNIGDRRFVNSSGPLINVGGQFYRLYREDGTHANVQEGNYVTLVPITVTEGVTVGLPADTSGNVRISTQFGANTSSNYPDRDYLQNVDFSYEDGIAHIFVKRGFFADVSLTLGAEWSKGGGLDDQLCDYYAYVIDETTARTSAPAGVRASAAAGTVTLDWYDVLPQNTYRIYRDTNADLSTKTLVGDVAGVRATDAPGGTGTYYYEVMTLDNGTERQSRVVAPYVSSQSSLTNKHVARVVEAGGDPATIELDQVAFAEDTLRSMGLLDDLAHWVQVDFGHVKDGSNILSKCFCLGTTLFPRGGDLTFLTSNTLYSGTAWNSLPGWSGTSTSAQAIFGGGRTNNLKWCRESGLTLIASFTRSNTNVSGLMAYGEATTGYRLGVAAGSPGNVELRSGTGNNNNVTDTHQTTVANSAAHIIGGVLSSTRATSYVEGIAGPGKARTKAASGVNRDYLDGQKGQSGSYLLAAATVGGGMTAAQTSSVRTYNWQPGGGQWAGRHLIVIRRALSEGQMATLNTALRAGP